MKKKMQQGKGKKEEVGGGSSLKETNEEHSDPDGEVERGMQTVFMFLRCQRACMCMWVYKPSPE